MELVEFPAETEPCEYCGGTGQDGDVVATDPHPVHMSYPCGWCLGRGYTDVDDEPGES